MTNIVVVFSPLLHAPSLHNMCYWPWSTFEADIIRLEELSQMNFVALYLKPSFSCFSRRYFVSGWQFVHDWPYNPRQSSLHNFQLTAFHQDINHTNSMLCSIKQTTTCTNNTQSIYISTISVICSIQSYYHTRDVHTNRSITAKVITAKSNGIEKVYTIIKFYIICLSILQFKVRITRNKQVVTRHTWA